MSLRRPQDRPAQIKLVLVMVGLPARGKTHIARRAARYLTWLGYRTRVFNVGNYRRERLGTTVSHHRWVLPDGMHPVIEKVGDERLVIDDQDRAVGVLVAGH